MSRDFRRDTTARVLGPLMALAGLFLGLALSASPAVAETVAVQVKRTFDFAESGVSFDNRFGGARLGNCVQVSDDVYEVVIAPENAPINDSAWYAFQVSSVAAKTITVRLVYRDGTHRYDPKVSHDGASWQRLPETQLRCNHDRTTAALRLEVGPEPLWVAGQELLTCDQVNGWMETLSQRPFIKKSELTRSVEQRPIHKLEITEADDPDYVVYMIGRQHPPEVTGAQGMMRFVEAIAGESEVARRFRRRFNTVAVPLMNPDGVAHGHWRHNLRGVDLNRDWGDFRQPATGAVRDDLLRIKANPDERLYLFLDFHSTYHDVFYTQPARQQDLLPGFTDEWLTAIDRRFPDYEVRCECADRNPFTSKAWVHRTLAIPAITYEFGDQQNRQKIRTIAGGAAEEMMKLLLAVTKEDRALAGP